MNRPGGSPPARRRGEALRPPRPHVSMDLGVRIQVANTLQGWAPDSAFSLAADASRVPLPLDAVGGGGSTLRLCEDAPFHFPIQGAVFFSFTQSGTPDHDSGHQPFKKREGTARPVPLGCVSPGGPQPLLCG